MRKGHWTCVVPWTDSPAKTEWHPTDRKFAPLSRGSFKSQEDAEEWGRTRLAGFPFSVKFYGNEDLCPCYPVSDLRLGDVVRSFDGPHSSATVCEIKRDSVKLFRPYTHTLDVAFGYSQPPDESHPNRYDVSTLSCFVGVETFEMGKSQTVDLIYRRSQPVK